MDTIVNDELGLRLWEQEENINLSSDIVKGMETMLWKARPDVGQNFKGNISEQH